MSKRTEEADNSYDFMQTVKGIIAVFVTLLVVVIIVMLFAKSLFVSQDSKKNVKTGHLTSTEYVSVATTTNEEEVVSKTTTKKKKTTTEEEEEEPDVAIPDGLDTSVAGDYVVASAVYLHPEANSSSSNLATLPTGAQVKVYGSANYGWYYVEYDGQFGYAYGTYFTKQ
jgi:hypothetical protein